MLKKRAQELLVAAFEALQIPVSAETIRLEIPRQEFGDLATNVALTLAKRLRKPPRAIAEQIAEVLRTMAEDLAQVEVAGPGFINLRFTPQFYHQMLRQIVGQGAQWGRHQAEHPLSVNVEFVSANPTGPLHLGHGRNAAIGDTLANLYEWMGHTVVREYYFNNAGNQMRMLALSIYARYRQLLGDADYPLPEDGYRGEYITDIARSLVEQYGDQLRQGTEEQLQLIQKKGEEWCFRMIRQTLDRIGVQFDVYFNEDRLYTEGKIEEVIALFRQKGLVYEKDGALWLKLTAVGRPQDRVIVKSTGEPTYRLPDIAYHREKFERGYDVLIDVFGADHIATAEDVKAALAALGYDVSRLKVILYQFVTLLEDGKPVKMSKRSGKTYTLDTLIDEVGADVVRFFFLMRSVSKHLEFDLNLAREQSEKNPVFYLQYAHARIASIFRKMDERGIAISEAAMMEGIEQLQQPEELALIKELARFPEVIEAAATAAEPVILADYLRDVATAFHRFYHQHPVLGADSPLREGRVALLHATQTTLRNGLAILGVSAPERM